MTPKLTWRPLSTPDTAIRDLSRTLIEGRPIERWRKGKSRLWFYRFAATAYPSLKEAIYAMGVSLLPDPGKCECGASGSWKLRDVVYGNNEEKIATAWSGCSSHKHRGIRLVPVPEVIFFRAIRTGSITEPEDKAKGKK